MVRPHKKIHGSGMSRDAKALSGVLASVTERACGPLHPFGINDPA